MIVSRWILLKKKNVLGQSCRENQNTHFTFNNFFPPKKSCRLWEPDRPQMTIQHGACALHAGWLRLQTHTFRMCNSYSFSTATMVTRTHLNVTFIRTLPALSVDFTWSRCACVCVCVSCMRYINYSGGSFNGTMRYIAIVCVRARACVCRVWDIFILVVNLMALWGIYLLCVRACVRACMRYINYSGG
jgi:hypothetical protein